MKTLNVIMVFSLVSLVQETIAQITISGEFRPRTEYRHGFGSLADTAQRSAFFTQQRSRLNFEYKAGKIESKFTLQDIRVWGSQPQLNATDGLTSVHEAWANLLLSQRLSLKFGRQEIALDDHRIFGNVGWAQQARSHDAAILGMADSTMNFQFAAAYNQNGVQSATTSYTVPKSYKSMQYLYFSKKVGALKTSWLLLNLGQQVNVLDGAGNTISYHDNYSQTIGTHTAYKGEKVGLVFNGYYQMGKTAQTSARDISALLLGLEFNYKISKTFTTTLGYEYQSGNSQTDKSASYASTEHAFNPFFGTNHKFNGFMDYFYVGNHIGNVGLQDVYLKLNFKLEKVSFGVDGHYFMAAADVLDAKELAVNNNIRRMSHSLGTEIDAYIGFNLVKGAKLKAGYSQLFATSSLAAVKGITNYLGDPTVFGQNNWAYVMVTVKPSFFTKE